MFPYADEDGKKYRINEDGTREYEVLEGEDVKSSKDKALKQYLVYEDRYGTLPSDLPIMGEDNQPDPEKSVYTDRNERYEQLYIDDMEGKQSPAEVSDLEDFFKEIPGKIKDTAKAGWEGLKNIGKGAMDALSEYGDTSKIGIYDFDPYHAERYYMALLQIDPTMAEGYKNMYYKRKELEKAPKDNTIDDIRATHNTYLRSYTDIVNKYGKDDPRALELKKQLDYTASLLAAKGLLYNGDTSNTDSEARPLMEGSIIQNATAKARAAMDTAVDKEPNGGDGLIDNIKSIERTINDIANSNPGLVSTDPWKTVLGELESLKAGFKDAKEASHHLEEEDRKRRAELDARIDSKYPNLRKEIASSNNILRIIPEGDVGVSSSRNEAVKKLSRMASDEALSGSDFAQALGRDGFLTTLENWANVTRNISDSEWNILKRRLLNAIEGTKSRRSQAEKDFSGADKALENIRSLSSPSGKVDTKKFPNKTASGRYYRVENGKRVYADGGK